MARTLSIGLTGDEVRGLQSVLNTICQYSLPKYDTKSPLLNVDGIFGSKTKARVVEVQSRNNIVGDGIVGTNTLSLLNFAMDLIKNLPKPPPPAAAYARMFAVMYAGVFHNRVTSDGRFATRKGYPRELNKKKLVPGMLLSEIGPPSDDEDCTHFISCCIGQPPTMTLNGGTIRGGGLNITTAQHLKDAGAYGRDTVPDMVEHLLHKKFATIVEPRFQARIAQDTRKNVLAMQPGDLIVYAKKPNPNIYAHMTILIGPAAIACHSLSRFGPDFVTIKDFDWVTLLRLP